MGMKIGELAAQAGCGVETVRHYERAGLLPPPARSAANYRQYDAGHLQRLRFIRRCRALGMSQDEVRQLLDLQAQPQAACDAVNACVDAHIGHVEQSLAELAALREDLLALRRRCAEARRVAECGILDALSQGEGVPSHPPQASHRHGDPSASCTGGHSRSK